MWLLLIFYSMALLLLHHVQSQFRIRPMGQADDVVAPITNPSTTQTLSVGSKTTIQPIQMKTASFSIYIQSNGTWTPI